MNSKAIKRQLLAAIAMVLVAALALGSSTYAWFASNNSVTATGMKISAKNDSGSLIIGATTYNETTGAEDPTLVGVQTANLTTVNLANAQYNYTTDFSVKPSQHAVKTTMPDLNSVANWSYKVADDPSNYASSKAATALTTFSGYVLYYDLWITVANGSPNMQNLKCNATIQATGANDEVRDAVRVLVASETAAEEFYNAHTETGASVDAHTQGSQILASTITSTALTHLRVYIYIDGEDATVFTNNFTNLKEATVSLSFTAENVPTTP